MDATLQSEINSLITRRILAYHSQLIENGQIQVVEIPGPRAIPPFSHCNQSEHMQMDDHSINLAPHQGDTSRSNLCEREHE